MLLGTLAIVQPAASPAQAAPGDTIIYGANGYGLSQIVELNLTQQTFQQVGSVARETQAVDQDPATGFVYFYEWKTTGNEFGYWNPANGSNTIVRLYNPGPGLYMKRMAFAPDGTLYVMDANDRLFTINKTNGNITSLGQVSGLVNGQWGGTGDMETREWRVVDQKIPVPFPIGFSSLNSDAWIPMNDSLSETFADIRRFSSFRAYHYTGIFDSRETVTDSRLIGRSVWNTDWMLIIPGGTFLFDPNEGLDEFVNSVGDIKIFFQTYAYSGN
jgi:hypothetical protein